MERNGEHMADQVFIDQIVGALLTLGCEGEAGAADVIEAAGLRFTPRELAAIYAGIREQRQQQQKGMESGDE
jgi:hypothetical protein